MEQFNISPSSGVPIYKQLFTQIERMILNGYFAQGDTLPSVRQVATDLEVNPMTVSKAYGLLEERGYLTRLRGKGMIVASRDNEISAREKVKVLEKMIEGLVTEAELMAVPKIQLEQLFTKQLAERTRKNEAQQVKQQNQKKQEIQTKLNDKPNQPKP